MRDSFFTNEIWLTLLAGLLSLLLTAFLQPLLERFIRLIIRRPRRAEAESYADRLRRLTETLAKSSQEVDAVLAEISAVAQERESAVRKLEHDLTALTSREQELRRRVDELQNVPIAVAEHFAALTAAGEKRSARRDYMLFGFGVVVSTLISIIFFLLQG